MKTIKINESFECLYCGSEVPPAAGTCRNHCRQCLWSLHVDDQIPGDRASDCHGLLEPICARQTSKGWTIVHHCRECGKKINNKILEDDNWDRVIELSQFAS